MEVAAGPARGVDDAWLTQVAVLPAKEQVAAVAAKLKDLNPGLDGKITDRKIEDAVVREVTFPAAQVKDYSPLRALPGLRTINGQAAAEFWKKQP